MPRENQDQCIEKILTEINNKKLVVEMSSENDKILIGKAIKLAFY